MVVFWLALGTATKLAFAVAVMYRTPWWWLPGTLAMSLGAVLAVLQTPLRAAGDVALVLGIVAILVAGALGTEDRPVLR
jgi:hypothetical protein